MDDDRRKARTNPYEFYRSAFARDVMERLEQLTKETLFSEYERARQQSRTYPRPATRTVTIGRCPACNMKTSDLEAHMESCDEFIDATMKDEQEEDKPEWPILKI